LFLFLKDISFKYSPILSIRPAEMSALEELPEKDKDLILPMLPVKGWVGSKKLINTPERIVKAFGSRKWIADIDASFIENQVKSEDGKYSREVFHEVEELLVSNNGYSNWYDYLKDLPNAIPTLQLGDMTQLLIQIEQLTSLKRGLVIRFNFLHIQSEEYLSVLKAIALMGHKNNYILFDFEELNIDKVNSAPLIASVIQKSQEILIESLFSVSGSSFPTGFANQHYGELPILERQLHKKVSNLCPAVRMVYSDRASTKVERQNGGGGVPYPRIDYPLKNDWRFIREEFENPKDIQKNEREELYTQIATELMTMDYWIDNLQLWGTQLIELTAINDKMGISNAMKATAVRINIHLHQQLHYDAIDVVDTDEDWVD
jgi:hypothetical protein